MEADVSFLCLENTRNGRWKVKDKWVWAHIITLSNSLFSRSFSFSNKYSGNRSSAIQLNCYWVFMALLSTQINIKLLILFLSCVSWGKLIKGWNLSTPLRICIGLSFSFYHTYHNWKSCLQLHSPVTVVVLPKKSTKIFDRTRKYDSNGLIFQPVRVIEAEESPSVLVATQW